MITEDQLEQLCLDWFREGGYEYAYGPELRIYQKMIGYFSEKVVSFSEINQELQ